MWLQLLGAKLEPLPLTPLPIPHSLFTLAHDNTDTSCLVEPTTPPWGPAVSASEARLMMGDSCLGRARK